MLGGSTPNVETIFHFRANLAFIQVQNRSRSEKLSESVEGTHYISSILGDGLNVYAHFKFGVILRPRSLSRMFDSSSCLLSIDIGGSSGVLR